MDIDGTVWSELLEIIGEPSECHKCREMVSAIIKPGGGLVWVESATARQHYCLKRKRSVSHEQDKRQRKER